MSTDEPYTAADMMPPPLPKRRISTGMKVLITLGILSLLMVLLFCGGLVAMGVWLSKSTSDDPRVIRQRTEQIVQIEIPAVLTPAMSFTIKVPFSDRMLITWVVYTHESSESVLVLASFGDMFAAQDQGEMRKQIEQKLRQEGIGADDHVDQWQGEEREISVRDEPVTFNFASGKNVDTGAQRTDVTGSFPGNMGPVLLILSTNAETLDEPSIVEMIESVE